MAKLVNQPEGGMAGAQKKFSLLVKGKLYEEEYEITLTFIRLEALKSNSWQSPAAKQTSKGKRATLPG
jgi:hypothetical protein